MATQGFWVRFDQWCRLSRLRFPVPAHSKHLFYALGGITFVGFLILFLTGLYLTQFFDPHPDAAEQSVRALMEKVPGGGFMRSMHYWTAQAVMIALGFHVLRVFITGAYKFPRVMTWYLGVGLFFTAMMGSYFSGTVMKWDQEGFEALHHYKVVMETLGPLGYWFGETLTGAVSLNLRMYTYHIILAPLVIILLVAGHFYLIHVFNISPLPYGAAARQTEVPREELTGTFTEHLWSIARFSLIYYGAVVVLSILNPAPLGVARLDHFTGEKPPWLFLWMYGVEHFAGIAGIIYGSAALLILLFLIPIVDRGASRDPRERRGILAVGLVAIVVITGFSLFAWFAPPEVHHAHGGHHLEEPALPPHQHEGMPTEGAQQPAGEEAPSSHSHTHEESDHQ
jgi:quinol-cytochrome oxidoreductase complex cytochrome b subunit